MILLPTRRARWVGSGGSSIRPARPASGRSGVHRRLFSFACRPTPRPQPPFAARLASASSGAKRARIRASDFERREGTRYTIDTVRRLKRRYPQHRFIWLLGSDTLPNFHKWRDWRGLARELPIAVIRRPGYDSNAHAARAMGWLRGFVHPSGQARHWTDWSAPAILFLRLPPDPTSATAIRAHNPHWYRRLLPLTKRAQRFGLPFSSRRPLDRTSR